MNNFTKKDIKNAAVVELRNGERFFKIDNSFINIKMNGEFLRVKGFNDDLTHKNYKDYDIMKVLNPHYNLFIPETCHDAIRSVLNEKFKHIVWTYERNENE